MYLGARNAIVEIENADKGSWVSHPCLQGINPLTPPSPQRGEGKGGGINRKQGAKCGARKTRF